MRSGELTTSRDGVVGGAPTAVTTAMFSTCLHCNASLGANAVIDAFPVGERLAFDPAKGRLWVVCRKCRRWNLTPLEERWEAIEACERLFRDTRLRSSTDNIGLARVAGGVDLVRIGRPLLPELAAWRYGTELRRRWMAQTPLMMLGGTPGYSTPVMAAYVFYFASGSMAASLTASALSMATSLAARRILNRDLRARVVLPDGQVTNVRALTGVRLMLEAESAGGWSLHLSHGGESHLAGPSAATRTLRGVLAHRNWLGGRTATVDQAIQRLQQSGDSRTFINRVARAAKRTQLWELSAYPAEALLALEMAVHDDAERRALEGELGALADEWALAEEVAKVADDMFLPESVRARFEALKGDGSAA